jgi:hypothetical protein
VTRRRWTSLLLVLATEGYLYFRYAQFGAQFHFWLHGLFGAALGLAALTLVRVLRTRHHCDPARGAVAPWEAGWVGHIYSAVPDVLLLGFGVLHVLWMDVFAFHITLHFIPIPLVTMLVLFLLALAAYGLAASRHPWYAVALLISGTGVLLVALALAGPSLTSSAREVLHPRGVLPRWGAEGAQI